MTVSRSERSDAQSAAIDIDDALRLLSEAVDEVIDGLEAVQKADAELREARQLVQQRLATAITAMASCPELDVDFGAAFRAAGMDAC